MILNKASIAAAALMLTATWTTADAYEAGWVQWEQKPGITLGGGTAGAPSAGLYMFQQFSTYQAKITGPSAPNIGGSATQVHIAVESTGFLIAPGWTFLGATYNAVIVQPVMMASVGAPANFAPAGMHNTYIVPVELSWKLADTGFFVKTGLGIYVPDGSISGANGLGNLGNPWWTFQPEFVVSYLKDGWNFTANIYGDFFTHNTITGYRNGDFLDAEFTATKTIGKWTVGPVAYYAGQVTNDTSSAFYHGAINVNRYNIWAVGAKVGYDFGPVAVNVWALDEISNNAAGSTPLTGTITKGYSVFASMSFRIWAPDEPVAPKSPLIHK
jgi:hypothetical protein